MLGNVPRRCLRERSWKVRRCGKVLAEPTERYDVLLNVINRSKRKSINFYHIALFSASAGSSRKRCAPPRCRLSAAAHASRAGTGQDILDKAPQSRLGPGRRIARATGRARAGPPDRPGDYLGPASIHRGGADPAHPVGSLAGLARAVHATRPASRFLSRSVADLYLYRSHPGQCPELFYAAVEYVFRRGRSLHLHLGLYGRAGLWPPARRQGRGLRHGADMAARLARSMSRTSSCSCLFIAEVSYTAATFKNPMYNDEMRVADFLDEPHVAIVQALLLQFQPAFLDILPMYILLLADLSGGAARAAAALAAGAGAVGGCSTSSVQIFDISVTGLPGGACLVFQPARLAVPVRLGRGAGLSQRGRAATSPGCCGWSIPIAAVVFVAALDRPGQLDLAHVVGTGAAAAAEAAVARAARTICRRSGSFRSSRWSCWSPSWSRRTPVFWRAGLPRPLVTARPAIARNFLSRHPALRARAHV